jgi:hypothetical protein
MEVAARALLGEDERERERINDERKMGRKINEMKKKIKIFIILFM